jgi:hypothetical protein
MFPISNHEHVQYHCHTTNEPIRLVRSPGEKDLERFSYVCKGSWSVICLFGNEGFYRSYIKDADGIYWASFSPSRFLQLAALPLHVSDHVGDWHRTATLRVRTVNSICSRGKDGTEGAMKEQQRDPKGITGTDIGTLWDQKPFLDHERGGAPSMMN